MPSSSFSSGVSVLVAASFFLASACSRILSIASNSAAMSSAPVRSTSCAVRASVGNMPSVTETVPASTPRASRDARASAPARCTSGSMASSAFLSPSSDDTSALTAAARFSLLLAASSVDLATESVVAPSERSSDVCDAITRLSWSAFLRNSTVPMELSAYFCSRSCSCS